MRSPLIAGLMTALLLGGCTKPAALPEIVVSAASVSDFAGFRADLSTRFPVEQLKDFEIAVQELQLDAMNRNLATAEERESDMRAVANGKTVHAVVVLGWQARKARFLREIAELDQMLAHDLEQQARTAAAGTPDSVNRRIGSEREVLAKLHDNLAATERHLAELARP
jgi:hypothetical protein